MESVDFAAMSMLLPNLEALQTAADNLNNAALHLAQTLVVRASRTSVAGLPIAARLIGQDAILRSPNATPVD